MAGTHRGASALGRVLALLEDLRLRDAVVCTHGEVIEQVLGRLVADGSAVDRPLEWPKGSTVEQFQGAIDTGPLPAPLSLAQVPENGVVSGGVGISLGES
jgi:hypothetical protein